MFPLQTSAIAAMLREQHLRRLSQDKISLERLISWRWIQEAFAQLQPPEVSPSNWGVTSL